MSSTDLAELLWRKSSYSNGQANCVEVAVGDRQARVCVRDSKVPQIPGLIFTARAWRQFVSSVAARGIQAGLPSAFFVPVGYDLAGMRIPATKAISRRWRSLSLLAASRSAICPAWAGLGLL